MSPRPTPPPADLVASDAARALAEDVGSGDVTAALLPDAADIAYLLCKEDAVVAGRPWFDACHRALDPEVRIDWRVQDGDRVPAGTVLATLSGRTRALVTAERAALNFLQTLSGTATTTAAYVDAVRGTGCTILDTRKTLPGLRLRRGEDGWLGFERSFRFEYSHDGTDRHVGRLVLRQGRLVSFVGPVAPSVTPLGPH